MSKLGRYINVYWIFYLNILINLAKNLHQVDESASFMNLEVLIVHAFCRALSGGSKDSGQNGPMPRLISSLGGLVILLVFPCTGLIMLWLGICACIATHKKVVPLFYSRYICFSYCKYAC